MKHPFFRAWASGTTAQSWPKGMDYGHAGIDPEKARKTWPKQRLARWVSHKSLLQFYGAVGLLRHPDRGVMMLIGYARVSTQDQTLRLQHDALTAGGCEKLFREKLSGTSTTLPAREKLLAFARKGDVVVVGKLDRLGRSLRDLIDVVNSLQDRGVGLRSLQEAIDTTTPAGKLTFHIFAALAEFERENSDLRLSSDSAQRCVIGAFSLFRGAYRGVLRSHGRPLRSSE